MLTRVDKGHFHDHRVAVLLGGVDGFRTYAGLENGSGGLI